MSILIEKTLIYVIKLMHGFMRRAQRLLVALPRHAMCVLCIALLFTTRSRYVVVIYDMTVAVVHAIHLTR